MLHILTGQNGSGKSLRSIWRMLECQKQGMTVYAHGYRNLRVPGVLPFDDPRKWRDLPPNSVLFIDEAQKIWRARKGGAVPPEVLDLETHRHAGIDIYMTMPSPKFLDAHLHELITTHEHMVSYDKTSARVFKFSECRTSTKSMDLRSKAVFLVWKYPVELYALYDSAEVHTAKPKIPFKQRIVKFLFLLAALLVVGVIWYIVSIFTGDHEQAGPSKKAVAAQVRGLSSMFGGGGGSSERKSYRNAYDYLQDHKPRIPEMPGSMPAMDGREVKAEPELYCMSSGEGREATCSCITEQGTRSLQSKPMCLYMARWGGSYNPYRAPKQPSTALAGSGDASTDTALRIMPIM